MKKISKILINIFCTLIIFIMLFSFIPITYLIRPQNVNRQNLAGFYAEPDNSLDMVYIGGSAAFVFWEPLRGFNNFGFTSYNFAHNSIIPLSLQFCVEEVLKTQSPEVLLIDLRPFQYGDFTGGVDLDTFHEVYIRNCTDNMKYSSTRNKLIEVSTRTRKSFSYYFDFFKYKSLIPQNIGLMVTKNINYDYIDNEALHPYKTFLFDYNTVELTFTDLKSVTEKKELSPKLTQCLIDLLEYCKSRNQKTLFIVHSYIQEEEHKMKYNFIEEIIESYGFDYLNTNDYYQEIGLDYSKDFYDKDHVNVFGAEKYTDFLGAYLKEHYTLPDKRNDPVFSDWHTLYTEFQRVSNEVKGVINQKIEERNQQ